ncbi:MlaD family protein [Teichococcus oryzae]|uniref:MCE family protein n=1 Tax=Teichococcus oryzae TaxID=1608942 RepID=A0A5B2TG83_9PROT|nr:MlaD family protein [Pseudoroseomonas oryzae]KAA2213123.1 MCE family protein [Pseudoroseomonas oryzae]
MSPNRSLYIRVGALILAGAALSLGFLLFLTGGGLRSQSLIFETYLAESVTGLEVGAPVRYRGVQIGQVSEIGLVNAEYPPDSRSVALEAFQLVLVRLAIDPERATLRDEEAGRRAVQRGLRAKLSSQGITGLAYIELDFVNVTRFPGGGEYPWTPSYAVIPSIPSTVAQVQNAAEAILNRIQQVPLEELLHGVTDVVGLVKAQVEDGDFARTLAEAAATLTALRRILEGSDLPALVTELRGVTADLRTLVGGPDTKAALASAAGAANELRQSLQRLPAVINALEQTARSARNTTQDTSAELGPLLRDLRATVGNLRDTTETLRRAPGQVLFGAPPPPR